MPAGLLAAILLGLSLFSFISSPTSYAGGGSYITWDSSMIYAGQNNGNPLGPVGEPGAVHGQLYAGANTQLELVLVPGDATLDINTCNTGQISLGTVTTNASGQFDFNFKWPSSASTGSYSICAIDMTTHTPVINQDGGPYSVLSANSPTLNQDVATVTQGSTVTISGQNWLPPQPITVYIGKCAACDGPTLTSLDTASTGTNGSFSVTITIPAGATPGNYIIDAISKRGNPLDAYFINGPLSLGIQAAAVVATPTATSATPTPTPAATATPVKTPIATPTSAPSNDHITQSTTPIDSNSSFLSLPLLIGGLAALLLLIVIIVGLIMWTRSGRQQQQLPSGPIYPQGAFTNYPPPVYPASQPANLAQNIGPPVIQQPVAQPVASPITPVITHTYPPAQDQAPAVQTQQATAVSPLSPPPGTNAAVGSDPHAPVGFCASCGAPFVSGTQFCGECGKSITNIAANPTIAGDL
jgi:hypothetical protein